MGRAFLNQCTPCPTGKQTQPLQQAKLPHRPGQTPICRGMGPTWISQILAHDSVKPPFQVALNNYIFPGPHLISRFPGRVPLAWNSAQTSAGLLFTGSKLWDEALLGGFSLFLFLSMPRMDSRVSHMLGRYSIPEPHPQLLEKGLETHPTAGEVIPKEH